MQRVRRASVDAVAGDAPRTVGEVAAGLCAFVAVERGDDAATIAWMARKLTDLRIFNDGDGRMNRSLLDVGGEALLVSNFTVGGDVANGNRPDYGRSAPAAEAAPAFAALVEAVRGRGVVVATGEFGADMRVAVDNDGPVTLILERRQ